MAGNIFDQFDEAPAQPQQMAAAGNIFDQFDTASLMPESRVGRFAAPQLPQQAPAPRVSREGFFISEYDDGSFGAGSITRPIIEGIKGAQGAAARYQPGTGDAAGLTDVIEKVLPPASVLGPGSAGGLGWAGRTVRGSAPPIVPQKPAAEAARVATKDLKAAGSAAYKQADEAGVMFRPDGVARVYKEVVDELGEFGYDPALQPKVQAALDRLAKASEDNITFKGMEIIRRVAGHAGKSADASEREAARIVIDKIDDLMMSPRIGETLAGDTDKGAAAIKEARTLWARMRKTEMVEEAITKAKDRASSTGSGGNENNAIRQNLRRLLDNPRTRRMFSKEEQDAIRSVVRGTPSMNTGRALGKLSPETGGLMMAMSGAMGAGAVMSNPLLALPPAVGFVAKRMADRGMTNSVDRLVTMVSSGKQIPVVKNWFDEVSKAQSGGASQAAMRTAATYLARYLAKETGEDENDIASALMERDAPRNALAR